MELQEAIRNRRSIRQFLAKPVSAEIIQDLIADALWSPSWGNTQPWEVVVVTGQQAVCHGRRPWMAGSGCPRKPFRKTARSAG